MFKDLFHKKKYATIPSGQPRTKPDIPEGLMSKCPKCGNIQFSKEIEKNLKVCPSCGHHFRLNAWERIAMTLDEGRLTEFDADLSPRIRSVSRAMPAKLEAQQKSSGLNDAVVTGEGTIGGLPVVAAFMSFDFFAGSMGSVVGEKITRAIEQAHAEEAAAHYFLDVQRRADAGEHPEPDADGQDKRGAGEVPRRRRALHFRYYRSDDGRRLRELRDAGRLSIWPSLVRLSALRAALLSSRRFVRSCRTTSRRRNSICSMASWIKSCIARK